jgi:sugar phosphate isomerase/epimerase
MKIGLSMLFCLGEPFSSLIKRLDQTDVKHIELVDETSHALNRKRVGILKEKAESYGVEYTVHAPFADTNIALLNPVLRNAIMKILEKSIGQRYRKL